MEDDKIFGLESMYWNNCLIRVALDCVLPMYEGMGLMFTDKNKFHILLKEEIRQSLPLSSSYPWLNNFFLKNFISRIESEFEKSDFDNFIFFVTTVYDTHSAGNWADWQNWKKAINYVLFPEKYQPKTQ